MWRLQPPCGECGEVQWHTGTRTGPENGAGPHGATIKGGRDLPDQHQRAALSPSRASFPVTRSPTWCLSGTPGLFTRSLPIRKVLPRGRPGPAALNRRSVAQTFPSLTAFGGTTTNMLITLFLLFLVSSARATEKGECSSPRRSDLRTWSSVPVRLRSDSGPTLASSQPLVACWTQNSG